MTTNERIDLGISAEMVQRLGECRLAFRSLKTSELETLHNVTSKVTRMLFELYDKNDLATLPVWLFHAMDDADLYFAELERRHS